MSVTMQEPVASAVREKTSQFQGIAEKGKIEPNSCGSSPRSPDGAEGGPLILDQSYQGISRKSENEANAAGMG
jgi:hypothetical protein